MSFWLQLAILMAAIVLGARGVTSVVKSRTASIPRPSSHWHKA